MTTERLPNWKIATLAAWQVGGAIGRVNTEDIADLCWKWAPARFSWKRYDYPDIRIVGEALRDAKKAKNGHLLDGDEREGGWLLTAAGASWAAANQSILTNIGAERSRSLLTRESDGVLQSLRQNALYAQWRGGGSSPSRFDVAHTIGLTADAPRAVVSSRLDEILNTAIVGKYEDIQEFVKWLRATVL
jgi:hypothetical protein